MRHVVLAALALTGCGDVTPASSVSRVYGDTTRNASLAEYTHAFQLATGIEVTVPVILVSEAEREMQVADATTAGVCTQWVKGVGGAVVMLRADYWASAGVNERWVLIQHELGHCLLGLDHRDELDPNGCAVSVMRYEIGNASDCLDEGRVSPLAYLEELTGSVEIVRRDLR